MFSQTYIDNLFVWHAKRMPITILSTLFTTGGSVQKTQSMQSCLWVAAVGAAAREDFADEE